MEGQVFRSINNIYSVSVDDEGDFLCRIKGKVLASCEGEYNPIVAGDYVIFNKSGDHEGMITSRVKRKSEFSRWNAKVQKNQTICANMDILVAVSSTSSPPFRPRFIDRVLCCIKNVEVLIVLNKGDIPLNKEEADRFNLFRTLGYDTLIVSAKNGNGIEELEKKINGKTAAFFGQSGVGKSTIINCLCPSSVQKTGTISKKYNRGRHTTNHSLLVKEKNYNIIDTPGVREIIVPHDDLLRVSHSFPEFTIPSEKCNFSACLHSHEPGCEVKRLVEEGEINLDRYESYLNILDGISEKAPVWNRHEKKN